LIKVEVPRSPPDETRIKKRVVKDTATIDGLPPYSDLEAYVVAANTYFESNASNTISFSTPEGGKFPPEFVWFQHSWIKTVWFEINPAIEFFEDFLKY
jgi:hypothetical protein